MSNKKLTILLTPLDSWGHINACHGIAEKLRDRGHRVVFALDIAYKGKLAQFGFEEELHSQPRKDTDIDFWADFITRFKDIFKLRPIDIVNGSIVESFGQMLLDLQARDGQYVDIINRVKPDVIFIDSYLGSPTLTNSGIPWVYLCSAAPNIWFNYYGDNVPPGWSGLATNADRSEWKAFRTEFETIVSQLQNKVIEWYKSRGLTVDLSKTISQLHPESKHLNIYMYPKELDWSDVQPLPQNYRRVDGFVRTTNDTFVIPESIRDRPGKLIFLSMGSFGCAILELMTRVTEILGKSKHSFIVSKGPLHDKYELPDNMWGQQFVPQTAILPVVDLVITHGGNNTVTETFFFGKPMLVLPMFGDQFDNAQRIQEKGLGARLSPYHSTPEEIVSTVDRLVNDLELRQKMKEIGERIRNSNDKEIIADIVENIVLNQ